MITGVHLLAYSDAAEKARAFLRDVLDLPSIDAGHGWLIFALPPAELAVHPTDSSAEAPPSAGARCDLYFLCDDVRSTMDELERKGVEFTSPIRTESWGQITTFLLPGAGEVCLYEPSHPLAIGQSAQA